MARHHTGVREVGTVDTGGHDLRSARWTDAGPYGTRPGDGTGGCCNPRRGPVPSARGARRSATPGAVHHEGNTQHDVPGGLQQRYADHAGSGIRHDPEGDGARDTGHSDDATRTGWRKPQDVAGRSRRVDGRARPSSSRQPTSTVGPCFRGSSPDMTLIERYTRLGPNVLEYQFTVDDPTVWTQPFTGRFNFGAGRRAVRPRRVLVP